MDTSVQYLHLACLRHASKEHKFMLVSHYNRDRSELTKTCVLNNPLEVVKEKGTFFSYQNYLARSV